jgi:hypothetical protein
LPNTNDEDDQDIDDIETNESDREKIFIFNFEKKWKIPSVNEKV